MKLNELTFDQLRPGMSFKSKVTGRICVIVEIHYLTVLSRNSSSFAYVENREEKAYYAFDSLQNDAHPMNYITPENLVYFDDERIE